MREAFALFLIAAGTALMWVAIHGYEGAGLPGILNTIYGTL